MGQIQFTVSLVLIVLFSIAIIGFAINFSSDNNVAVDVSGDSEISNLYSNQVNSVERFRSDSEDTYSSLINSTISSGDTTTASGGQFKITPKTALNSTKNILSTGYSKIFGNDSEFSVFLTSFFSMLLFIVGLLIWKTWAGRNPE